MMSSSTFFDMAVFLLSRLFTCPSFMSISLLVLELRQFSFIKDWPKIQKSVPPSRFCPNSEDWVKLGIPYFVWMTLMKCHWMLQNTRITASTVSELLRETQEGKITTLSPQIRVRFYSYFSFNLVLPHQNQWDVARLALRTNSKVTLVWFVSWWLIWRMDLFFQKKDTLQCQIYIISESYNVCISEKL